MAPLDLVTWAIFTHTPYIEAIGRVLFVLLGIVLNLLGVVDIAYAGGDVASCPPGGAAGLSTST